MLGGMEPHLPPGALIAQVAPTVCSGRLPKTEIYIKLLYADTSEGDICIYPLICIYCTVLVSVCWYTYSLLARRGPSLSGPGPCLPAGFSEVQSRLGDLARTHPAVQTCLLSCRRAAAGVAL